jgi:RNA polymerase sigma-70 factor (ECF subfamily)
VIAHRRERRSSVRFDDADPLHAYLARPTRRRLERVVRFHASFVWNRAIDLCDGHEDEAEDLLQDVFLRLLLSPPPAGSVRHARAWLGWLVLSRAGHLREAARRRLAREEEAARRRPAPADERELLELREAIERLPDDLRDVVALRYFAGDSSAEIAGALGLTDSAVRKRLARARAILAGRLTPALVAAGIAAVEESSAATAAPVPLPRPVLERALKTARVGKSLAALTGAAALSTTAPSGAAGGLSGVAVGGSALAAVALVGVWLAFAARTGSDVARESLEKVDVASIAEVDSPPDGYSSERAGSRAAAGRLELGRQASADATAPEEEAAVPDLHGRVLATDGEAIANARVEIRCENCSAREWVPEDSIEQWTDEDGRFAFDDLPAGRYRLSILSGSHGSESDFVDAPRIDELSYRLDLAPSVAVRCERASTRTPLDGAVIEYRLLALPGRNSHNTEGTARTDDNGRFAISLQPGSYEVTLWSGRFRASPFAVDVPEKVPFPEVPVLVEEGVTVEGVARAKNGVPLPLAAITWQQGDLHEYANRVVWTDAHGRFRSDGLAPGPHWVRIDEHATEAYRAQKIDVGTEALQSRDITFDTPGDQIVFLVDDQGDPVVGLPVTCEASSRSGQWLRTRTVVSEPTDAAGGFAIRRIGPGSTLTFDLEDETSGYVYETIVVHDPPLPATLRFTPWIEIDGTVEDPAGEPVRSAVVRATSDSRPSSVRLDLDTFRSKAVQTPRPSPRRYRRTRTDEDGHFAMRQLWEATYRIEVLVDDSVRAAVHGVELGPGAENPPLRIALEELVPYRVHVRDPRGGLVPGVRVGLEPADGAPRSEITGESSAEGIVELDALAGKYDVTLERSRWTALTPLPTLSLDQPEGAIVVEPFDDGLVQIPGVVLHESAPVAGAWVRFVRHKRGRHGGHLLPQGFIATDAHGHFTLTNERGASMWITAHGPGFAMARSELVVVPAQGPVPEIPVVSLPGEDLTVRTLDANGNAVPPCSHHVLEDERRPTVRWLRLHGRGRDVRARAAATRQLRPGRVLPHGRATAPRQAQGVFMAYGGENHRPDARVRRRRRESHRPSRAARLSLNEHQPHASPRCASSSTWRGGSRDVPPTRSRAMPIGRRPSSASSRSWALGPVSTAPLLRVTERALE